MHRTFAAAVMLAVGGLGVNSASAVTTNFTQTTPTAGAITDDSQLLGRVTNQMIVNVPAGQDWTNSKIRITLIAGTVYNATPNQDEVPEGESGPGTESNPNSFAFNAPGFRQSRFDSFVNSRNLTPASILGTVNPDGTDGPAPAIGLRQNNVQLVSVAWGNTTGGESGSFSVGQFTLSATANGTFFGQSFDTLNPGVGIPFSGNVVNGVMVIPEPASAGLLAVGIGALALRRRRVS